MVANKYTIESIRNMTFESDEPADLWAGADVESDYMLTTAQIAGMPEDETHRINELRCRLSEIFAVTFHSSYAQLECACGISHSLFQKVLKFRNGRNITYNLLAKFCVGAKLSVEEAQELFMLMGHTLSDKNRSDYILKCELTNHGDIAAFDEDLKRFGLDGVFSSTD